MMHLAQVNIGRVLGEKPGIDIHGVLAALSHLEFDPEKYQSMSAKRLNMTAVKPKQDWRDGLVRALDKSAASKQRLS